jgi:hypothetical protein
MSEHHLVHLVRQQCQAKGLSEERTQTLVNFAVWAYREGRMHGQQAYYNKNDVGSFWDLLW